MELQNFLAEEFNNENSVIDFQSGIFEGIEYKGEHPSAGEIMEVLIKKLHPVDLFSLQNRVEVLQTLFNEYESYQHKESLSYTLVLEKDQFKFIFNNSNINLHGYEYTEKYNQNPEEEVYPYGITIAYKTTERGKNNSHYKIFEEVEFHGRIYVLKASRDTERNKPREVNENTDEQEEVEQIADFIDKNKDYICINEGIFDEFRRGTPTLEEVRNTLKTKLSPDDLKKLQGLIGTPEENGALREFLDKSKQLVINNRDYFFFKLVLTKTELKFKFPMVLGYQVKELNYNNSDELEELLIPLNDKLVTSNSSFSQPSNVKKSISENVKQEENQVNEKPEETSSIEEINLNTEDFGNLNVLLDKPIYKNHFDFNQGIFAGEFKNGIPSKEEILSVIKRKISPENLNAFLDKVDDIISVFNDGVRQNTGFSFILHEDRFSFKMSDQAETVTFDSVNFKSEGFLKNLWFNAFH